MELQGSVVVLEAQSRAEGARFERLIEELTSDLKASIATDVRKGITGAALGNAARAAASEGARKIADEFSAQALDMNLLDSIQSFLAAVVESEGEATQAAVASSQAELEVAIERGRTDVQSQLDDTKREAEIGVATEEESEQVTKRRTKKFAVSLTFK